MTGYLGGAVATHLRVGSPLQTHVLFPVYVAVLIWSGLVLRRAESTPRLSRAMAARGSRTGPAGRAVGSSRLNRVEQETNMKFMVMVKATERSEAGEMPSTELLAEMGKFNEELHNAGVLLAGEGLHPSSKGVRVRFSGSDRTVVDGPFAETKELIAGFWLLQVRSLEECIAWVRRSPNPPNMVSRRSRSGRSSRPTTSARRSRPNSARRKRPSASRDVDGPAASDRGRLAAGVHQADRRARALHARPVDGRRGSAHDALVAALQQWPVEGIPRNAGAWLMATGKRRAIDLLRHRTRVADKHQALARDLKEERADPESALHAAMDDDIGDDVLRLIFTACHPVLPTAARVALTLRMVGGLTTDEIARAFLVPEATIAQRIVRAKKTIANAGVPFEVPRGADRLERLSSVLEVVYLVFNEGYSASSGDDLVRPSLCDEAIRLGRVLAGLAADEPEVHGLVALMELQASRLGARVGTNGEAVRLLDQNRARWDHLLIHRGLGALDSGRTHRGGRARTLHAAGGDRCLPCARQDRRRDGLAADRLAVCAAGGRPSVAGGAAQPRRRRRHGGRARGRPGAGGRTDRARRAGELSLRAERPRRSAREAGAPARGAHRVRARRHAHAQCARTGPVAGAFARVRARPGVNRTAGTVDLKVDGYGSRPRSTATGRCRRGPSGPRGPSEWSRRREPRARRSQPACGIVWRAGKPAIEPLASLDRKHAPFTNLC